MEKKSKDSNDAESKVDEKEAAQVNACDMTSEDYYFDCYAHFDPHEDFLKDKTPPLAYYNAMCNNRDLFKGKVVLDVGCGLGVLSMFAARAGAARVYAVECSSIAQHTEAIIADNNLSHVVTVIKGKVEEVVLPDACEQVDIIISNWMGYCLFHESMLDTVLYARDKWLKKAGYMFPDRATLFICGIQDEQYKQELIDWWEDVYDFDMSCIRQMVTEEPVIDTVEHDKVVTNSCVLRKVNLYELQKEDASHFEAPFSLQLLDGHNVHALVTYFKVEFTSHKQTSFSTAPSAPYSHWQQTIFPLDKCLTGMRDETITGNFSLRPNARNRRDLDITTEIDFKGKLCTVHERRQYGLH